MFRQWCQEHGFMNATSTSHVLMDGGVLSVPFDRLNEFYQFYIQCITNGERVYVVEQKTKVYNFFMDVDYVSDESLSVDQIESISKLICDTVGGPAIVSVSKPKPKNGSIKTGIHYNWNGLVVDQKDALKLRTHVIVALTAVYTAVDWSKSVDDSVYKGSGFRMLWSHKKGKHEACGGQGCQGCQDSGKITEDEYIPILRYTADGIQRMDPSPSLEVLVAVTVRTLASKNSDVPEPVCKPTRPVRKEGTFTAGQTKNELRNPDAALNLETFIRQNLKGQSTTRVQKLFRYKESVLVMTNSKFCENIGRDHTSNHVWFLLKENGTLRQRCFCKCETLKDRKSGFCKDFSGRAHLFNNRTLNELFPNKKSDTNKKNVYLHLSPTYSLSNISNCTN